MADPEQAESAVQPDPQGADPAVRVAAPRPRRLRGEPFPPAGSVAQAEPAVPLPVEPPSQLTLQVEAALISSDQPLSTAKLAEWLGGVAGRLVDDAIEQLNRFYTQTQRSFRIEAVAGGWQVMTLPQFAEVLSAMHRARAATRLSPAAMETLAIIAYRQPIQRAQVEAIRGVASGEVIRSLMDRRLVRIVGRAEELGRPMLYGTTRAFLEAFGLASLKDLPKAEELRSKP